ncbi:hypothetical protein AGLY_010236 [Aphis glycines]|uniref:C2H2-type domain-containing protein n=1 Tax=Aphis glycines TaxID=307491 RepID=A0A6G0THM3_APHGL|nr:hypothetical protein AGLY_010236 [Aphis glycines]
MAATKEDYMTIKRIIQHEIFKRKKRNQHKEISKDNKSSEEYTSMLKKLKKNNKRKKEKTPNETQNINNLGNVKTLICTEQSISGTNKLISDFIEPKITPQQDLDNSMNTEYINEILKYPLKETEEKEKSKIATKEETELSGQATKHKYFKENVCLENNISENYSKEMYNDTTVVKTTDNSRVSNMRKVHEQLKKLKYMCEICGSTFTRQSNLIVHQKIHTLQKEYVCDICGKAFIQKTNLKNHQRGIHTGERPHRCDICDKSFSIKSSLNKHRLIHTGEKPHVCDVCGQSFTQRINMVVHTRRHTGERPYKCGYCEKSFLSSSQRTKHIRSFHDKHS